MADTCGLVTIEGDTSSSKMPSAFLSSEPDKEQQSVWDGIIDFSPRGIDLENFPFGIWRKLSRDTLVDDNREMFGTGDPVSYTHLNTVFPQPLKYPAKQKENAVKIQSMAYALR